MRFGLYVLLFYFFTSTLSAKCNFKSGEYIDKLSDPSTILLVEILTPKSAKYNENAFKILSSNSQNIHPKLKKRFKANINIIYEFGICKYKGSVRQTGDWKDHINFDSGGKLLRSLDVKLEEGNILNAVRFKLFIPETRKSINEVLASLILRKLNFIAPETFEVKTKINNVNHKMLFQETTGKELLERNLRREGAIFEGDETLLWSYKKYENFELENLSLARLINTNWFKKGSISQEITLQAFSKLQQSYLNYTYSMDRGNSLVIFPNQKNTNMFSNYFFVLISMNGSHALRPHNRKFFYNTLRSEFEPVYYDGDIYFNKILNLDPDENLKKMLLEAFTNPIEPEFLFKIDKLIQNNEIQKEFIKRVHLEENEAIKFIQKSIKSFIYNKNILENFLLNSQFTPINSSMSTSDLLDNYRQKQREKNLSQKIIKKIKYVNDKYDAYNITNEINTISIDDLSKILSKNKLNNSRVVLINNFNFEKYDKKIFKSILFKGSILHSPKTLIKIFENKKIIEITQSSIDDWVFIDQVNLSNWKIKFKGLKILKKNIDNSLQRFNIFGLTGCLTINDSILSNTSIILEGGKCEDSLNIINSQGSLSLIDIKHSNSDGVDLDFSKLIIKKLIVKEAINDCLDVSGGDYYIKNATLINCGDKGISIGEKSTFKSDEIYLNRAFIGVSSKDLSTASVLELSSDNVNTCIEVMNKKQEFGGANLHISKLNCSGLIFVDDHSKLLVGDNEF